MQCNINLSDNLLGSVYQSQGRYAEALDQFQQALAMRRETGGCEGEGVTLYNIGTLYVAQDHYDKALDYFEQSIAVFEDLRAGGSEDARASFIAQYAFLYDHTVELYYLQDQFEKAFLTSERGRARAFLDTMVTGHVILSDNKVNDLYVKEQEAYTTRQSVQEALANAKSQTLPDAQLIRDLEAQLVQAEKDYQAALDAISASDGQLAQLVPGQSAILDVSQAQALLDDQTALLSFWVLDERTLVFIITHNTFNTIALPVTRLDLNAQIAGFRAFTTTDASHPESAIMLYHTLIEPIESYLTLPRLEIVPQGDLHYLPFAALTNGSRYLLDDYTIAYLPSVSAWPYIKENATNNSPTSLILGNPATNNADLKPLPYAESEAQAIAAIYQATPLLGKDATESALYDQSPQAGVLHIAAHGNFNIVNPLYTALYLAPDEQQDGALEVHEIYGLDLNRTDIVVLSACQTQLGKLSTGDELVGLTRAFFFAGTPTVISSLWEVDDHATGLLMEKFYAHWRNGMDKAGALRQAQIEVRAEYPNPYYWAGFVLSGEGNVSMPFKKPSPFSNFSFPTASLRSCCGNLAILYLVLRVFGFAWRKKRNRKGQEITVKQNENVSLPDGSNPQNSEASTVAQNNAPLPGSLHLQDAESSVALKAPDSEPSLKKLSIDDELQKAYDLSKSGKYQEALNVLHQIIQVEPENAEAWMVIGFTLAQSGDVRSAERGLLYAKKLGHPKAEQALEWLRKK